MAIPIIDSVVAVPSTIPPGGTSVVTIVARDPDSRDVAWKATSTDSQGNVTEASTVLTISDVLSHALSTVEAGWTIVQRASPQDHIFDVTAPA